MLAVAAACCVGFDAANEQHPLHPQLLVGASTSPWSELLNVARRSSLWSSQSGSQVARAQLELLQAIGHLRNDLSGETSTAQYTTSVCMLVKNALPVLGYNGVLDTVAKDLRDPTKRNATDFDTFTHVLGQYAMEEALRDGSAKAAPGVLAIAAYKTAYDLKHLEVWDAAPVHSGAWAVLLAAKPPTPDAFWKVSMELCTPLLNTYAFLNCLHGVGHGAALHSLARLTDSFGSCECVSHMTKKSARVTQRALAHTAELCSGAPSNGLGHLCGGGMWMTLMLLAGGGSEAPFAEAPSSPQGGERAVALNAPALARQRWLPMNEEGEATASAVSETAQRLDGACDVASFPNFCFYFYIDRYDEQNTRVTAKDCAERPMSRAHRLHCVFSTSADKWSKLESGRRVSTFCNPHQESALAAMSAASPPGGLSNREHFVACLTGVMYEHRLEPRKETCGDLAQDVPDDKELHDLCQDASNFCDQPGACSDPREAVAKTGDWLHEHSRGQSSS